MHFCSILNHRYCHFFQITGIRAGPLARNGTGRAVISGLFSLNGLARPGPFSTGQKRAGPKRAGQARFATPMSSCRLGVKLGYGKYL